MKGVFVMGNDFSASSAPHLSTLSPLGAMSMARKRAAPFNPQTFLARAGDGSTTLQCAKQQILFVQGDAANGVFYILQGRVKLSVISPQGKEAVVALLEAGDFFGEACLAGQPLCMVTATSLDTATIMRIDKATMTRILHHDPAFSELFMSHLVTRTARSQEDLVDHLFHSAEKRLARVLLLLAHFGEEGNPGLVIPKISQETLAEMVGTTRSRVSFFMNRFRRLGFIEYGAEVRVHKSLVNVVLSA
ncbi:MAG: Crp/Fnr family transcriptional regulator [Nitrospiraceae bacterium]